MLRIIGDCFDPVQLPGVERCFLILWLGQVDINEPADVSCRRYQLILHCVGVQVMEQLPEFLLGWMADTLPGQLFDSCLQVGYLDGRELQTVQLLALPEGDVVVFSCGN